MTDEFFPPATEPAPETDIDGEAPVVVPVASEPVAAPVEPPAPVAEPLPPATPEPVPAIVESVPEVPQTVSEVIQNAAVPVAGPTVQELAAASAQDPTTKSPFKPTPGVCGHCGNADSVEPQSHYAFCYKCGRWSDYQGNPIMGNPHARANVSETFPWANAL